MEKENKLKFPLNLQLFGEDSDEEDLLDDEDFDDDSSDDENENQNKDDSNKEDSNEEETKKKQSREENARQARLRREKEQREKQENEERIRKEAYEKGKLDSVKENKFTKKPIKDKHDLKIYEIQCEIEARGGDPINDLPEELSKLAREDDLKKSNDAKQRQTEEEKIKSDITDFRSKYKTVDIKNLLNDPLFNDYASEKLGKQPLTTIYEKFMTLKNSLSSSAKKNEEEEQENKEARKNGSSPSAGGGKQKEKSSYSQLSHEAKIKELKRQGLI